DVGAPLVRVGGVGGERGRHRHVDADGGEALELDLGGEEGDGVEAVGGVEIGPVEQGLVHHEGLAGTAPGGEAGAAVGRGVDQGGELERLLGGEVAGDEVDRGE